MEYNTFVRCAVVEDSRNRFGKTENLHLVPECLKEFYGACDPVDVEVSYPQIGAVRFCGAADLADLQQDYNLPEGNVVFATCNGDPVFVSDGKVFTSVPEAFRPELLANSLEEFLAEYVASREKAE